MELLVFALILLFSLVSALLERRKRRQAQQPRSQRPPGAEGEEEEQEIGWPFPTDPFELEPRGPRQATAEETEDAEQQAQDAEQRILEMQRQAQELERQAREVQPRRRMDELVREKIAQQEAQKEVAKVHKRKGQWRLDPQSARQAVVYSEILGRPKSERKEEGF